MDMDQIGNELKKVLQAGIGAVAIGVEKTQEVIENLAQKGEPIYEQAKATVTETAGKIVKAVQQSACKARAEKIIEDLKAMTQEELDAIRSAIYEIYPNQPKAAEKEGCCCEEKKECACTEEDCACGEDKEDCCGSEDKE